MPKDLSKIEKLIEISAKEASADMTADIRHTALMAGWPAELAQSLSVKYTNGELYIDYPEELQQQIYDQEYGNQGMPPKSVIRTFTYRSDKYLQNIINEEVLDELILEADVL